MKCSISGRGTRVGISEILLLKTVIHAVSLLCRLSIYLSTNCQLTCWWIALMNCIFRKVFIMCISLFVDVSYVIVQFVILSRWSLLLCFQRLVHIICTQKCKFSTPVVHTVHTHHNLQTLTLSPQCMCMDGPKNENFLWLQCMAVC